MAKTSLLKAFKRAKTTRAQGYLLKRGYRATKGHLWRQKKKYGIGLGLIGLTGYSFAKGFETHSRITNYQPYSNKRQQRAYRKLNKEINKGYMALVEKEQQKLLTQRRNDV